MSRFLVIQPVRCRVPLVRRTLPLHIGKAECRVLEYDPTEMYQRIAEHLNPYQRIQTKLTVGLMFPNKQTGACGCGCGKPLIGRRRRWANAECTKFAVDVYRIVAGYMDCVSHYLWLYNNHVLNCVKCSPNISTHKIQIDHILGVAHGGGGCWLSNYQPLCVRHHVEKTNQDFGRTKRSNM